MESSRERTRTFTFGLFTKEYDPTTDSEFLAFTARARHSGIEYTGKVLGGGSRKFHIAQVAATTWKDKLILFNTYGKPEFPESTIPQLREEMEALAKALFSQPKVQGYIGTEAVQRIFKPQRTD